jgi:hypothetical protein
MSIFIRTIFGTPFDDFEKELLPRRADLIRVKFDITGITVTSYRENSGNSSLITPFYENIDPPSQYPRSPGIPLALTYT